MTGYDPRKLETEMKIQEKLEEKRRDKPFSIAEVLNMEESEEPFLVEKLIPLNGITTLSGYPSSGKSWILLHIAYCIAAGKPVFSQYPVTQGAVLMVDEEAGIREFKRRVKLMSFPTNTPVYLFSQQEFKIDNEEHLEHLLRIVKENEIKLIIFDPFVAIHSKAENSAEEMQEVMQYLQQFNLIETSVLFAHHHRKQLGWQTATPSQSLRGSSVLFGRVDSHLAIEKKAETKSSIDFVITQVKLRRGKAILPFQMKLVEENNIVSLEYAGEFEEEKKKIEEAKEIILESLKEKGRFREEIIVILKEHGIGRRNAGDALTDLEKESIIKSRFENRKKSYWLSEKEIETANPPELSL